VLEDEDVRSNARQLVLALLEQPYLQVKTGEHLWAAMKGGVLGLGYPKPKAQRQIPQLPAAAPEGTAGSAVSGEAAAGAAVGGAVAAGAADPSSIKTPISTAAAAAAATGVSAGMAAQSASRQQDPPEEAPEEPLEKANLEALAADGHRPLEREFALVRRASDSMDRRRRPADRPTDEARLADEALGGRAEPAAAPAGSLHDHEQSA
jgi:hypothetical protein